MTAVPAATANSATPVFDIATRGGWLLPPPGGYDRPPSLNRANPSADNRGVMAPQPKKRQEPAAPPPPAPAAIQVDPHRLERRASPREKRSGSAMGAFYDAFGGMSLSRVRIVDSSRGGIGLLSDVPAAPGSRVTLYGDDLPVPRMTGIVARCQREGDAWRIGLRCDASLAA